MPCGPYKDSTYTLSILVSRGEMPAGSLLTFIDETPHTRCTPERRAWMAGTRLYALRRLGRNLEAIATGDTLFRSAYPIYLRHGDIAVFSGHYGNALFYEDRYTRALPWLGRAADHYRSFEEKSYDTLAELEANYAWGLIKTGRVRDGLCLVYGAERTLKAIGDTPRMREIYLRNISPAIEEAVGLIGLEALDRLRCEGRERFVPVDSAKTGMDARLFYGFLGLAGAIWLAWGWRSRRKKKLLEHSDIWKQATRGE